MYRVDRGTTRPRQQARDRGGNQPVRDPTNTSRWTSAAGGRAYDPSPDQLGRGLVPDDGQCRAQPDAVCCQATSVVGQRLRSGAAAGRASRADPLPCAYHSTRQFTSPATKRSTPTPTPSRLRDERWRCPISPSSAGAEARRVGRLSAVGVEVPQVLVRRP